jgi:hypothetical protein
MKTFFTAIMVIVIVTGLVVGFGGFNLTTPGGAHISLESDYAEVEQARLAAETERTRIAAVTAVTIAQEQGQTVRIVWPVTVVALAVAAIGVAWTRRPHRPQLAPPPILITYVERQRQLGFDVTVEEIDGEWVAADHDRQLLLPAGSVPQSFGRS